MHSSKYRLDRLYEVEKEGMRENIPSILKLIVAVFFLTILPAQVNALTPGQGGEWIDKVKSSSKTIDNARSQIEWRKRFFTLLELEDWHALLGWCKKWTESEPKDAKAWCYLGIAYKHLKLYNDAIKAYRQATQIDPEYADAWYNLGLAYFLSENRAAALEAVQKLRRLDPANGTCQ
jgi:tetratricopeptide (TPR) repeat protein